jgi:DNA-binding CsgD family transcriptional regulator/tetratricopeptide (TPR) repeat protein
MEEGTAGYAIHFDSQSEWLAAKSTHIGRTTDVIWTLISTLRPMSTLGPLLSPLLVGRDDLLQLAERRIAEAAAGRGHLLLLAGEAGVGKTRLLRSILRKATAAGFRTAKGDLAPQDAQLPLASILDLARTMNGTGGFGDLGDALLTIQGGRGADSLGSRRLLVRDIAQLIVEAIDEATLLAFEDLQWADELSIEVIGELARIGEDRPMLLLGAYRADELPLGSLHREWRARLLSQRLAEEARLQPLTFDETALVTTLILNTGLPAPREVVTAVYQRTDGIPLHIEELLGALGDDARSDGRAIRDAEVPDTIEDAILARLSRLSDEAQAVAVAGAVMGRCFSPDVLAGVLDRPVGELEAPLEELVAYSFLYPFEQVDEGYYDFRHQLLRDALYETVPAAQLRRMHARAGEFVPLLIGANEVHASAHFERAGLKAQAFETAVAGARAASAVSSRREAFELYARAVANIPDGLSTDELGDLYAAYGEAAAAIDDVATEIAADDAARGNYLEAGRLVDAAFMLVMHANMLRRDVQPRAERERYLDQAAAELEALPESAERAMALSDVWWLRAMLAMDVGDLDAADVAIAESRSHRRASDDTDMGDIDFLQAALDVVRGRTDDGLDRMMEIARDARQARLEATGVTAYRMAAAFAIRVMDYERAEVGLTEGLRYADEIQQSYCRHILAATSAHAAWAAGRWDEAIPIAEIEIVERGSRRGTLGSRDALGFVCLGRGDTERARSVLETSLAIGRSTDEVDLVMPPLWGLAETALVDGNAETAVAHCEAALSLAMSADERAHVVPFVVTGVRAHQAMRRPDAAERWAHRVRDQLADWQRAAPALAHADGLVRLAAGATTSARASLEAAVAGWDDLGRIWESSWARLDLAACLIRGNRHLDAIPVLDAVRTTAKRLQSPPLLARVEELTSLARRRGIADEPWRPLTAREFEVARHVSEGLTNAGIAHELGLSPKTVSAHIEHILAKLGAMRRTEIAAWVALVAAGQNGQKSRTTNTATTKSTAIVASPNRQ